MANSIEEILTPEIGRVLRSAREARGLSATDAATRLRLNPHYIEAMEAGDLRPLPPGPYRKAFVNEYAKFLNIKLEALHQSKSSEEKDGIISSAVSAMPGVAKKMTKSAVKTTESVVKKVEEGVKDAVEEITARDLWEEADEVRNERLGITARKEEEQNISIRKKNESPATRVSLRRREIEKEIPLPPIEEPIAEQKAIPRSRRLNPQENIPQQKYQPPPYEPEEEREVREGMSRTTKTIVGLLVIIAAIVGYSIFTKKSNQPVAVIEPELKTAVKQPEQKLKPVIPPKKDSTSVAATPSDSLVFTISAKDSVWVSVSPDVGKGFRGKLAKGEMKRFSAKEKYFLFLGNQKSVSMTLDGKPLTNLPTVQGSNLVVRNAVLTRDKISVAPSEQSKPEASRKDVSSKKKENSKKKTTPASKKNSKSTAKKKAAKIPPIKMQIPSIKPVLPG